MVHQNRTRPPTLVLTDHAVWLALNDKCKEPGPLVLPCVLQFDCESVSGIAWLNRKPWNKRPLHVEPP